MKITTAEEMRTIDRVTSERFGVHSLGLMENAGTGVALFARAHWPDAERITVVCGKGNNGGDGFVAARKLHQAGKVVEVLLLGDSGELKGDAANMFGRLPVRPVMIRNERDLQNELSRSLGNTDLIVDAILGTGFRPPVTGLMASAIEAMNHTSAPVLAVDIPSGASADSYGPQDGLVARADAIVTFTAPRPAHLFGQLTRGLTVVAAIGSPAEAVVSRLNLNAITASDIAPMIAPRPYEANKGRFGHVLVIGGSLGKVGAAGLAGIGALRAGAGLTTVAVPSSVVSVAAGFTPEIMTESLAETGAGTIAFGALDQAERVLQGKTVVAIGPGISRDAETERFVRALVTRATVPVVLDADGLNAFEAARTELNGKGRTLVVTPHPGEMARLTGKSIAEIQADRIGTARAYARERQCITVLKGYRTIIAAPQGDTWVVPTGNAGMATGGTGDVLTGVIAGMLAQHPSQPVEAVCAAAYLHGMAGDCARDEIGEHAMIASDLLRYFGEAIQRANEWSQGKQTRIS